MPDESDTPEKGHMPERTERRDIGDAAPEIGGLRARNAARAITEVSDVALALFVERGFDATTVDDIAEAAGISRRTFFRYFESKEDAVLPYEGEHLDRLREALEDRTPGEPVLWSIRRAALEVASAPDFLDRHRTLARLGIMQSCPSVHARSLELQSRWEEAIRDLIAEHLGADPATSIPARVVAGAATAAFRAAGDAWLASDGSGELADLLGQAFDVLTDGLGVDAAAQDAGG